MNNNLNELKMTRKYNPAKRGQFPNMAKLITNKCHEKNIRQIELSPVLGAKAVLNGQLASHVQLGKQTIPLKRANEVCQFLGITKEEFTEAYLSDFKLRIDKNFNTEDATRGE